MAKLVSTIYGDALFELALEEDKMDILFQEAAFVRQTFLDNEEVLKLFNHPKIGKDEKESFLVKVFEGNVSEDMVGFLHIIVAKDRYNDILPIFDYFIHRVKEYKGIGTAKVTSAVELSADQRESIEKKLLDTTRYESFEMDYQVDPAILGGLIIRIEDRVVDSSLKTQLDKMTKELTQIRV